MRTLKVRIGDAIYLYKEGLEIPLTILQEFLEEEK